MSRKKPWTNNHIEELDLPSALTNEGKDSENVKKIEEMARAVCDVSCSCDECSFRRQCSKFDDATKHYNAGYRKQIEGKWVLIGNGNGRAIHWKCSVCGYETLDASNGDTNFCPNCGADMRGGPNIANYHVDGAKSITIPKYTYRGD